MRIIFSPAPAWPGARPLKAPDRIEKASAAESIADKLTPKLAKAVLDALITQAGNVDLDAIVAALQKGDAAAVLKALGIDEFDAIFGPVQDALTGATGAAGLATMATINTRVTTAAIRFNQLNPRLILWLQNYSLSLIKQVNDSTLAGVRAYLVAGMNEGKNPVAVAREVKGIVGLTERQALAVKRFRTELETFHTRRSAKAWNLGGKIDRVNGRQVFKPSPDGTPKDGVDQRRLRDFRFDGQLQRAMTASKPLTPAQIDKMVAAYERKYRKYRAETIARTEALRATNAGVQDAWRQAIESGKIVEDQVRRRWIVARDERLCEICQPIPGMNKKLGVPMGQPFATPKGPVMLPPIHPSCRCVVLIRQYEPAQIEAAENPQPSGG